MFWNSQNSDSGPLPLDRWGNGCFAPGRGYGSKVRHRIAKAKMRTVLLLGLLLFGLTTLCAAEWTAEKKNQITEYMKQYLHEWTIQDTERWMIPDGSTKGMIFVADDGRQISVQVFGQSVLVDGKDISGNLGSRTT